MELIIVVIIIISGKLLGSRVNKRLPLEPLPLPHPITLNILQSLGTLLLISILPFFTCKKSSLLDAFIIIHNFELILKSQKCKLIILHG